FPGMRASGIASVRRPMPQLHESQHFRRSPVIAVRRVTILSLSGVVLILSSNEIAAQQLHESRLNPQLGSNAVAGMAPQAGYVTEGEVGSGAWTGLVDASELPVVTGSGT